MTLEVNASITYFNRMTLGHKRMSVLKISWFNVTPNTVTIENATGSVAFTAEALEDWVEAGGSVQCNVAGRSAVYGYITHTGSDGPKACSFNIRLDGPAPEQKTVTFTSAAAIPSRVRLIMSIDRSKSMTNRIADARKVAGHAVELLASNDAVGFSTFTEDCVPKLEIGINDDAHRTIALDRIGGIAIRDKTPASNLRNAVLDAKTRADSDSNPATKNLPTKYLFITDGKQNMGAVDADDVPSSSYAIGFGSDSSPSEETVRLIGGNIEHNCIFPEDGAHGNTQAAEFIMLMLLDLLGVVTLSVERAVARAGAVPFMLRDAEQKHERQFCEADLSPVILLLTRPKAPLTFSIHAPRVEVSNGNGEERSSAKPGAIMQPAAKRPCADQGEGRERPESARVAEPRPEFEGLRVARFELPRPAADSLLVGGPYITHVTREKHLAEDEPYTLIVAARSDLVLDAQVHATGLEVGAELLISAVVKQWGVPLTAEKQGLKITAELEASDDTRMPIALTLGPTGFYSARVPTLRPGVYRLRFWATGRSFGKVPFERQAQRSIFIRQHRYAVKCCTPQGKSVPVKSLNRDPMLSRKETSAARSQSPVEQRNKVARNSKQATRGVAE